MAQKKQGQTYTDSTVSTRRQSYGSKFCDGGELVARDSGGKRREQCGQDQTYDGRIWRCHVDHVIKSKVVTDIESACSRSATSMDLDPQTTPSEEETAAELVPIVDSEATAAETDTEVTAVQEGQPVPTGSQGLRRSSHISRPPDRLQ